MMRSWPARSAVILAMALTSGFGVDTAFAQADRTAAFPTHAIKIIVPFPAGGPTDINIRIIAQRMGEDWRVPVVIENRPGANTAIGAQAVARAEPNGYTLLAAMDSTLVMNPAAATGPLSYDPFNDFAAITLTAKNTSLLTVRADDGPRTVKELIARGKAGRLTYGAGIVITRLAGYLLGQFAGIDVQFIPYKGSSDVGAGAVVRQRRFHCRRRRAEFAADQGRAVPCACQAQQSPAVAIA
jgi:tripartite-type tricarboxylate transporter receptor subunit TctC